MTLLQERILSRVAYEDRGYVSGCWISDRSTTGRHGHTAIRVGGRLRATHIVAYEEWVGPVPEGLVLDHLCRQPPCCNPEHLEPVTRAANTMRGESIPAKNARKTHCPRGHEYTEETTWWGKRASGGLFRMCRLCPPFV